MNQSCCTPQPLPQIIIGYAWLHNFCLSSANGFPVDLSTATEITVSYQNLDGSVLVLTLTDGGGVVLVNGPAGVFSAAGTSEQSALLALGNGDGFGSVLVTYTIAGVTTAVNLQNVIQITNPSVVASS